MEKSMAARHYRSRYDLQRDFRNIKNALADTGYDVSGRMAELLADSAQDIKSKSLNAKENAGNYISERPLSSLGAGIFAGFLVGLISGLSVYFLKK